MTHVHDGSGDDFGCKVKTLQWAPSATPSRHNNVPSRTPNNSWEKGVATDHRGLPYLGSDLQPIPIKKFSENRRKYVEAIRRNKAAATQEN